MIHYSKENFEDLVALVTSEFSYEVKRHHTDIVEFFYGGEIPVVRLVFVEAQGLIAICFHVAIPKTDAFYVMDFIRSKFPHVEIGEEYIVDSKGATLVGNKAYEEMERAIEDNALPPVIEEEFVYEPEVAITLTIPYATYHAQDPKALEIQKQLELQRRYYGKFKWEE